MTVLILIIAICVAILVANKIVFTMAFDDATVHNYCEMIYGLLLSQRSDVRCIDKEKIVNYIEFHLDRHCDPLKLRLALKYFDYNGSKYSLPEKAKKLEKINTLKDLSQYRYSATTANVMETTKLDDLQTIAACVNNEAAKKYYVICLGLIRSVKCGVSSDGLRNYVMHQLGTSYDDAVFNKVLSIFAQRTIDARDANSKKLCYGVVGSGYYYLYRNVFGYKLPELGEPWEEFKEVNAYKCTMEDAYNIAYPEITENIKKDYQNVLDIVATNGEQHFREGIDKIVAKYKNVIGNENIEEYIHILTRKWYFEGNATVDKVLSAYLEVALWAQQQMSSVASVALRTIHFKNYNGVENEYQLISDDECREFILSNDAYASIIEEHPYEKEKYLEENIRYIKNAGIFSRRGLCSTDYWMPDLKTECYYADAVCVSFLQKVTQKTKDDLPDNPNKIYNIIWKCIELSDEERQKREEEKSQK
ncbi:MAG: hypothetical protein IKU26_07875 [Clostridia bacterium]|nr:hypothetical protein [Clostridia bacterium]